MNPKLLGRRVGALALGLLCLSFPLHSQFALAANPPAGFEDPAVLQRVMDGEIVLDEKLDTGMEFQNVFRAYFHKVSPDAYQKLVVQYNKYPMLFSEVIDAKLKQTMGATHTYEMKVKVNVAFFSREVDVEGTHTILAAKDAVSEGIVEHEITNHRDLIRTATQRTRLIPWANGMLVEDTVVLSLQEPTSFSRIVKRKIQSTFKKQLAGFRTELGGDI